MLQFDLGHAEEKAGDQVLNRAAQVGSELKPLQLVGAPEWRSPLIYAEAHTRSHGFFPNSGP